MGKLIGLFAAILLFSIPALAQKNGHPQVGGGHIPAHGPAAYKAPAHPTPSDRKAIARNPAIPALRTLTSRAIIGSATTQVPTTRTIIWIIPGNTDTLPQASAAATCGILPAVDQTVSGSVVFTLA